MNLDTKKGNGNMSKDKVPIGKPYISDPKKRKVFEGFEVGEHAWYAVTPVKKKSKMTLDTDLARQSGDFGFDHIKD